MTKKVADLSAYQGSSETYMKSLKSHGIDTTVVKLTEGVKYVNPKAREQISNGFKVFGTVSVYHFFHGHGSSEAKYFLAWVKSFGLDKSTVLALDVEAQDLPWKTTAEVNAFLKELKANGFTNVITYGSGSWFAEKRIDRAKLIDKHIWVAAYGVSQPGIDNANAWQYTDNYDGLKVDASLDFDGSLSGSGVVIKPAKPEYYQTPGLYEATQSVLHQFNDVQFKSKRHTRLIKGSRFYATPIKYGKIYRLSTPTGYYTANKDKVKFIFAVKAGDK